MKIETKKLAAMILAAGASSAMGAAVIEVGTTGFAVGSNQWPDGEPPSAAIDGAGQKYLNFGEFDTGVLVTPSTAGSVATRLTLWAANDAEPRDPSSYSLLGTNAVISGPGPFDLDDFTPISSGGVSLPSTRNDGGAAALDPANSWSVDFANTDAYDSYLIYFPTVKDEANANSMQIAEIQLFNASNEGIFSPGDAILGIQVPEPSSSLLAVLALGAMSAQRRRKA